VEVVGLDRVRQRRLVAPDLAAAAAAVHDHPALLPGELGPDRLHDPAAVVGAVAGVHVDVQRAEAGGAVVAVAPAPQRLHLGAALAAGEGLVRALADEALHDPAAYGGGDGVTAARPTTGARVELIALRGVTVPRPGAPEAPPLLAGVDLSLGEGTRLGLVGRSGAGKSTLLALLAGEVEPVAGRVVRAPGVHVARLAQSLPPARDETVWEAAAAGLAELRAVEAALRAAERDIAAGAPEAEPRHAALLAEHARLGGYGAEARLSGDLPAAGVAELRAVEAALRAAERDIAAGAPEAERRHAALLAEHERLGGYGAEARLREVLHALGFAAARHGESAAGLSAGERRRLALA